MRTRPGGKAPGRWAKAAVTGGSAGIGLGFAQVLAASGTDLLLVARGRDQLDKVAGALREQCGVSVETMVADLAQARELEHLADELARSNDLDLLVNNVGGGVFGVFGERAWDSVQAEVATNLQATLRLTHAVVGPMKRRGRGSIVNVAAGTAFYPTPYSAVYGAAKAFVVSLSEAMSYELQGSGVSVTAVCPGFTRTEGPSRHGFDVDRVPRWWWSDPQEVATVGLRATARRNPVVSPGMPNVIGATVGRHLPRRLWVPGVARTQLRLRRTGARTEPSRLRDGAAPSSPLR